MPQPYELLVCYDGNSETYYNMLKNFVEHPSNITMKNGEQTRYQLLNQTLNKATGRLFMHLENDFYWVDPACLRAALYALDAWSEVDFIRFEQLPFNANHFYRFEQAEGKDILWMKRDAPYRFNFNPHIRRFKFPGGEEFSSPTYGESEQIANEKYGGVACCMTGDNFRHLGIYDEAGNHKEYYADRFTGKRNTKSFNPWVEFIKITDNPTYLSLFKRYLDDNRN